MTRVFSNTNTFKYLIQHKNVNKIIFEAEALLILKLLNFEIRNKNRYTLHKIYKKI